MGTKGLNTLISITVLLTACTAAVAPRPEPTPVVETECNCMWYAYEALKRINVRILTVPSVVISSDHGGHGFYSRGVVSVPDNRDCRVMVHEFVHHYQYERYGEQKGHIIWNLNEMEAYEKSVRARNVMGDCR